MLNGVVLLFAAQAATVAPAPSEPPPTVEAAASASYGPALPPAPKPKKSTQASAPCSAPPPVDTEKGEVFVCAPRPEGYRIDADVLKAAKQHKNRVKPKRPERLVDTSCASVGPHGCPTQGVDIINAAVVLATMAERALSGGNVGQMFVTDPQLSEYDYYKIAKAEREAEAAVAAGKKEPIKAP